VLDQITLTYSLPSPAPASLWTISIAGVPLIVLLILLVPAAVVLVILVLFLRYARSAPVAGASSVRCTTCGSLNQPTNKFCFRCGQPVVAQFSPPRPPT
jgi:LSD1 subclass zinc finger protein